MSPAYATTVVALFSSVFFCLGWMLGAFFGYRKRTEEVEADLGQLADEVVKTGVSLIPARELFDDLRRHGLMR